MENLFRPAAVSPRFRFLGLLAALVLPAVFGAAQSPAIANVIAFGADASGAGDSTQAFSQAIATGKMVYVPAGHYKISNHDVLALNRPGQMIFGDGPRLSVLNYTGPCQPQAQGSNYAVLTLGAPHQAIRSLGVTSDRPQKCIVTGIAMNSDHGLAEDDAVTQMWFAGFALKNSYNSVVDSDIQYNRFGVGINGDHHLVRGCYISNHYSSSGESRPWTKQSFYWDGIVAENMTFAVIDSNTIVDNGQSGIYTGGNNSVSYSNVITNNTVRHNRNEGIDQGVSGPVVPGSNYVGKLVIAGNTSEDNFGREIWLNEVDGAIVAWNTAQLTGDFQKWWKNDSRVGSNSQPVPCMVWESAANTKSDNIVFVNNTCGHADSSQPALIFNPGAGKGNVVGNNTVRGQRQVDSKVDRSVNVVMPEHQ